MARFHRFERTKHAADDARPVHGGRGASVYAYVREDGTVSAREYPAYSSVSDSTGVQFRRTANVGHRGASSQLTYAPRLVSEQAGLCRPVGVVSDGSLMRSQGRERRRR
ncbi:hypothetical protein MRX96_042939 [Rhipicephalus microplus]